MNDKRMTTVDTSGAVLQMRTVVLPIQFHGTGVLRVVSEDGVHLFDVSEVSDDSCINIFIHHGEALLNTGFLPRSETADQEILIPRESVNQQNGQ